jgi:hypothetical protein
MVRDNHVELAIDSVLHDIKGQVNGKQHLRNLRAVGARN